jgi:hypothetical protein
VKRIKESKLSLIFFEKVVVKVKEFDIDFALLELMIVFFLCSLLRVKHRVKRFEVGGLFWIV